MINLPALPPAPHVDQPRLPQPSRAALRPVDADAIIASRHTNDLARTVTGFLTKKCMSSTKASTNPSSPRRRSEQHRVHTVQPRRPLPIDDVANPCRKNHARRSLPRLTAASGYPHRLLIIATVGSLAPCVNCPPRSLDNQVSFLGYVSHADLLALYSAADCFLAPSLYEVRLPCPRALWLAAPVVCSAAACPKSQATPLLIVSPHDGAGLVNAIRDHRPTTVCRLRAVGTGAGGNIPLGPLRSRDRGRLPPSRVRALMRPPVLYER